MDSYFKSDVWALCINIARLDDTFQIIDKIDPKILDLVNFH